MTRIVIIDDHPVVREGLAAALTRQGQLEVAGAFGSAEEYFEARPDADVVLLDLELPGMSGVEAVERIDAPVLILTAYAVDEEIEAVLRAGASGYLLKGAAVEEIERAIRSVAAGQTWIDPRVAVRLVAFSRAPRLTARERDVLGHLSSGRANKEIAASLGISERTVKFHVTSILTKLGAENRTQALAIAHERGLV
jgi:two-component system NarL family response regulator